MVTDRTFTLEKVRLQGTFETRNVARILLVFLGMVALATLLSKGVFLQPANLLNLVNQNTILMLVALGQLLVILTGGIDLSVGSIHAIASVVLVLTQDLGLAGSLAAAMLVSLALGAVNGGIVTLVRLPSFVVTLGMMQIAASLAMVVSKGGTVYTGLGGASIPPVLTEGFKGAFLGIPNPILISLAAVAVVGLYLRTSLGHFTYAVGGNRRAAFLSGIPVRKVEFLAYLLAALIAGLSGVLFVARVGLGDPQAGRWLNLDSIAAVSIGGAGLSGGVGNVIGTLLGVLIISVLNNIMNLLGVPPTLQPAIKGMVILLAVFLNSSRKSH
jgi:ribose/xylose/arabinose/galactoside ABC-type transport system permease subunit